MEFSEMIGYIGTILGIIGIIMGWVNSKSKNDKASATEVAEMKAHINDLEKALENKVSIVQFTEMMGEIKGIAGMIKKLEGDMHSVLNDSGVNANQIAKDQTRLDDINNRLSFLESKVLNNK